VRPSSLLFLHAALGHSGLYEIMIVRALTDCSRGEPLAGVNPKGKRLNERNWIALGRRGSWKGGDLYSDRGWV